MALFFIPADFMYAYHGETTNLLQCNLKIQIEKCFSSSNSSGGSSSSSSSGSRKVVVVVV